MDSYQKEKNQSGVEEEREIKSKTKIENLIDARVEEEEDAEEE